MVTVIEKLEEHVKYLPGKFLALGRETIDRKTNPDKWSKKEILGHLVDSAINNLQRLIRLQYEPGVKIVYNQVEWVRIQDYQNQDAENVVQLWLSLNRQFIQVLKNFPSELLDRKIDTGKVGPELHSAEFLITDYLAHLELHLRQIFTTAD